MLDRVKVWFVARSLADPDPTVRMKAVGELDQMGAPAAIAPLVEVLGALERIGDPQAVPAIVGYTTGNNHALVSPLIELLANPGYQIQACEALADLRDARAMRPMMNVLLVGDLAARRVKARALVRLAAACPDLRSSWNEIRDRIRTPHNDHMDTVHNDGWTKHQDCMINGVPHVDKHLGERIRKQVSKHQDVTPSQKRHSDDGVGLDAPEEPILDF